MNEFFVFLADREAPATNNISEPKIRLCVVFRNVTGSIHAGYRSVTGTARLTGRSALGTIRDLVYGRFAVA